MTKFLMLKPQFVTARSIALRSELIDVQDYLAINHRNQLYRKQQVTEYNRKFNHQIVLITEINQLTEELVSPFNKLKDYKTLVDSLDNLCDLAKNVNNAIENLKSLMDGFGFFDHDSDPIDNKRVEIWPAVELLPEDHSLDM